jgi:hypothetical protein
MNNEPDINCIDNQRELMGIRNTQPLDSEMYRRAKDKIRDIQLDTNNKQTGALSDFIKEYKKQTDKLNRNILILTILTAIVGAFGLLLQFLSVIQNSNSYIEVIQIDKGARGGSFILKSR